MPRRSSRPAAKRSNSTARSVSSPESTKSRKGSDVSASELFRRYLDQCPLVAIVRGIVPGESEAIGDAIHEAGIRIIEVPLNSPDPLISIERLAKKFGDGVLVGAGTVLDPDDVARVREAGGRIIVSPDTNVDVIAAAAAAGFVATPGYFTLS